MSLPTLNCWRSKGNYDNIIKTLQDEIDLIDRNMISKKNEINILKGKYNNNYSAFNSYQSEYETKSNIRNTPVLRNGFRFQTSVLL